MERPGILIALPPQRIPGRLAGVILLLCSALLSTPPVFGGQELAALDHLAPIDKYRQLNLILMVSEGAKQPFPERLRALAQGQVSQPPASSALPLLQVDDFQTPLNRIVDQRTTLSDAARLFQFSNDSQEEINQELAEIAESIPDEIINLDFIQLTEDAIIIRMALTGSIEFLVANSDPVMTTYVEAYNDQTIHLRNVMEYLAFEEELASITSDAMDDTGGRMEAYQRMLEDEHNLDTLKQHIQAVELIYRQTSGRKAAPNQ